MTLAAAGLEAGDATPFWAMSVDALFVELHSAPHGLTDEEAARRLAAAGPNVPTLHPRRGTARLFVAQFTSPITLLLLVAAILSLALGEVVDGSIILGILLASALLGFWQEHRATDAVARLLGLIRTTATVVRAGTAREVPLESVVPGDVVQVAAGAAVPADARLISATALFVDQSALSGESFPAEKCPGHAAADAPFASRANAIFLGTHVVSGTATALVARTGRATEFGTVAGHLAHRPAQTEFEHGVRRFGYLLLELATALAIVILAINVALDRPVLDALLFTLALTVGLTPQLLPAIVTVTLSQGARHMARERVIVRRLGAIEDLGGMQLLCTDKTGTITQGVVAVQGAVDWSGAPSARVRQLAQLNATFETGFPNPIDDAIRAAQDDAAVPDVAGFVKVSEVPFDFVRRRLSVVVDDPSGRRLLITKGAVGAVLEACERVEDAEGHLAPLAEALPAIQARYERLSRDAYRCLGVAWRELPRDARGDRGDESALVFAGILTLTDLLKPSAAGALRELAQLGIDVKLVTGDNRHVAARLAAEAGLDASVVRTGTELQHLGEAALVGVAPRVGVFAELEPSQKERVIHALRKAGRTVGYLGDGINDAGALHAADCGISVDSAADVTKQAADIVLLEKDLAVLVHGVREGRRAFANTLKYVFVTTSANFGNMFSMAGASLFAAFLPLLPKQILLINVLTDLPSMAIATDRLDPELVARPRRWDTHVIRRFMLVFGLVSSVFDFLTFGLLLALGVPPAVFRSGWFVESVLSEILILLVIRTRRSLVRSAVGTALLWSSVAVGAVTITLPYSPLAAPLGLVPLSPALALLMLGIVVAYGATAEVTKRVALGWAGR